MKPHLPSFGLPISLNTQTSTARSPFQQDDTMPARTCHAPSVNAPIHRPAVIRKLLQACKTAEKAARRCAGIFLIQAGSVGRFIRLPVAGSGTALHFSAKLSHLQSDVVETLRRRVSFRS